MFYTIPFYDMFVNQFLEDSFICFLKDAFIGVSCAGDLVRRAIFFRICPYLLPG